MGCDIHTHIEVKINGVWEHYSTLWISRDYELFGLIAGVRMPEKQKYSVKGFPKNASLITKLDYNNQEGDAHTPSYLHRVQLQNVREWHEEKTKEYRYKNGLWKDWGYLFGNDYNFNKHPEDRRAYPKELEDVRMVFWFDN